MCYEIKPYANLQHVNFYKANLYEANLYKANLYKATLQHADLRGANLRGANLQHADLRGASLRCALLPPFQICPQEGSFIAYKAAGGVVIKLEIPAEAGRTSSLVGRMCRAEYALVVGVVGETCSDRVFKSGRGGIYETGKIYHPDSYDDDIRVECIHGVHFFMTIEEAQAWL